MFRIIIKTMLNVVVLFNKILWAMMKKKPKKKLKVNFKKMLSSLQTSLLYFFVLCNIFIYDINCLLMMKNHEQAINETEGKCEDNF